MFQGSKLARKTPNRASMALSTTPISNRVEFSQVERLFWDQKAVRAKFTTLATPRLDQFVSWTPPKQLS
jgi:hypothetical protein